MNGQNVATTNGAGLPANTGSDPFTSYAAKVTQQTGQFLTFKNGEYLYGQDAAELPLGTKLAANVAGLMIGWRRWFGGKVTDDLLDLLTEQKPLPTRSALGDNDPAMWEKDDRSGAPRDPWMFTNSLTLVDNEGETYIYSTGSKGGLNAIGQLCKAYGQEYRQRSGMVPIVELANDFYIHATYGKTYVPVFNLVGWTDEGAIEMGATDESGPAELPAPAPKGQRAANPMPRAAAAAPPPPAQRTSTTTSPSRAPRF